MIQDVSEEVSHVVLCQICVVADVGKGKLGFDHPELSQMTARVAVLCPKGRPERVDAIHGESVGLGLELTAHSQKRRLAEEILRVVNPAICPRGRVQVESGDLKHLAGAFRIAGGDHRGVYIQEVAFLVEFVSGVCQCVSHPSDGSKGIRARPQVGNLAQFLEADSLFL